MPSVGVKPDGSLAWIDAQGNEVNPDGSPIAGGARLRPLTPPTNTTPGQAQPTPTTPDASSTVPAAGNIDPNAGLPRTTQPAGPPSPGQGTTPALPPTIGAPQGPGGMFTVDQTTEQTAKEVQQANVNVTQLWSAVNDAQKALDYYQSDPTGQSQAVANPQLVTTATSRLNSAYQTLSSGQQRVETANAAYSTALTNAIKLVDPNQVDLVKAQIGQADANAAQAKANAQILIEGSDAQKAKTGAEATQASALAAQAQATADATKAKTPAEVQQLQSQANLYGQQSTQIQTLLPGLVAKQQADTTLTQHQVTLTDAQSDYYQANAQKARADADYTGAQADYQRALIPGAAGLQAGQTAQALGAGAASQATAAATLEGLQQKVQGPMYGLQQQLQAIKDIHSQFFGPGSGLSPEEATKQANDAMRDYFTATVAGTTPYAASVAAANYQQNQYGQQMSGVNALQGAMAQRANQYAQLGGTALSQMAAMNQYAPRGSTAGAAAFREVMDEMAQRLAGPQFAPVQLPQGPPMPALLQSFAAGHAAGTQQATAQGAPGGQSPTINVNVNGQPAGGANSGPTFNPQASTAAMNAAGFMDNPAGRAAMASAMGGTGASLTPMPYTGAGVGPPTPMPATASSAYTGGPIGTGPGGSIPMPAMLGGYFNPPSISATPATAGPAQPAPAYVPAPVPTIPNLMQNYMGFANPMNMIGMRGA